MMIPENKVAGKLSSWQRINKSSQMVVFDMMKIFDKLAITTQFIRTTLESR